MSVGAGCLQMGSIMRKHTLEEGYQMSIERTRLTEIVEGRYCWYILPRE